MKSILKSKSYKNRDVKIKKLCKVASCLVFLLGGSYLFSKTFEQIKKDQKEVLKTEKALAYQNGYDDGYIDAIVGRGEDL